LTVYNLKMVGGRIIDDRNNHNTKMLFAE